MNFLNNYYTVDNDKILISAEQGSTFAKDIAGDFNPIHNPESKRFCVPGDLLFAVALQQYGLHSSMSFQFLDLVSGGTPLNYPASIDSPGSLQVANDREKPVLGLQCSGESTRNVDQIEQLLKKYVAFSGHNFPHILVPLMEQHKVMINPKRPLVIYESMALTFDHLQFDALTIDLEETTLNVEGRRGNATLHFSLNNAGQKIGSGKKTLVLSGLREYESTAIKHMCEEYESYKNV